MNIDNKKLFVGNLPFSVSEQRLQELFERAGAVASVAIPVDRETGRKRGFAFVEMDTQSAAEEAIKILNGTDLEGRQIAVNPSQPSASRGGRRW